MSCAVRFNRRIRERRRRRHRFVFAGLGCSSPFVRSHMFFLGVSLCIFTYWFSPRMFLSRLSEFGRQLGCAWVHTYVRTCRQNSLSMCSCVFCILSPTLGVHRIASIAWFIVLLSLYHARSVVRATVETAIHAYVRTYVRSLGRGKRNMTRPWIIRTSKNTDTSYKK